MVVNHAALAVASKGSFRVQVSIVSTTGEDECFWGTLRPGSYSIVGASHDDYSRRRNFNDRGLVVWTTSWLSD